MTTRMPTQPESSTPEVLAGLVERAMRFPVQLVNRPHLDFRGFAGTLASGRVAVGDEIVIADSGRTTRVSRIVTMDGDLGSAEADPPSSSDLANVVFIFDKCDHGR